MKCCLYPPANLPWGKTFFPSERRKSNSFYYRNHTFHRIRDRIPRKGFLAVFASYPLQQPQHHTNPCLFCVFVPLSPSFFRGADRILPESAEEDMTFASVNRPCLFAMVMHLSMLSRGGGRAWGEDLTFFNNLLSNSLPTGKSFQSIETKFPHPGLHIAVHPKAGPKKVTIKISPKKTPKSFDL